MLGYSLQTPEELSRLQQPCLLDGPHRVSTTILKGWPSLSPGLRATSYPGNTHPTPRFTLKGLYQRAPKPVVQARSAQPGGEPWLLLKGSREAANENVI